MNYKTYQTLWSGSLWCFKKYWMELENIHPWLMRQTSSCCIDIEIKLWRNFNVWYVINQNGFEKESFV